MLLPRSPSLSPASPPSPAQTSPAPRSATPAALSTTAAPPSSSRSCRQSAPSVSASAQPGLHLRPPAPAATAPAPVPRPSACGQSSRCASSSVATRTPFRLASASDTAASRPLALAWLLAAGKLLCALLIPASPAPPAPDSPPPASPARRRLRRSSAPKPPPAVLCAFVRPSAAVDVPRIACPSRVYRSRSPEPWCCLPFIFPAGKLIFLFLGKVRPFSILGQNVRANKARNRPCSISRAERKAYWPKFFASFRQ